MWVEPSRIGWSIFEGGTGTTLPMSCCVDDDDDVDRDVYKRQVGVIKC